MDSVVEIVSSGSLLLALPVAFAAGLVAFLSPCVLPLAPGYLSYMTGMTGAELADPQRRRWPVLAGGALFVLGFSIVFVSYGALFGAVGSALLAHADVVMRVLGVIVIVMGLAFMGVIPGLQREWRPHRTPAWSIAGAPLLGILFGIGWTPCIGPTLAVVQSLAITEASAARGALLSFVYCLGLGLPFVVLGLAFAALGDAVGWIRRHSDWVMRIGGAMLVIVGVLLVSGAWTSFTVWLRVTVPGFETVL